MAIQQAQVPSAWVRNGATEDTGNSSTLHPLLAVLIDKLRREGISSETIRHMKKLLDDNNYVDIASKLTNITDIESFLTLIMTSLDNGSLSEDVDRRKARRLFTKLGPMTKTMPQSLKINHTEVTLDGNLPFDYGKFCNVFKGEYRGTQVALKRLHKSDINNKELHREALAWRTLSHKSLLPFMGVYIDQSQSFIAFVSPLMKQTLSDWRKAYTPIPSVIVKHILDVAQGVNYLHREGLVHGDLRGNNILLDFHGQVKIADFGLTRHMDGTATNSFEASLNFTAPEFLKTEDNLFKRTPKMDVFAFACLYYEIQFDYLPFHGLNLQTVCTKVISGQRPGRRQVPPLTEPAWVLINQCWADAAEKRPSMEDVLQIMTSWK